MINNNYNTSLEEQQAILASLNMGDTTRQQQIPESIYYYNGPVVDLLNPNGAEIETNRAEIANQVKPSFNLLEKIFSYFYEIKFFQNIIFAFIDFETIAKNKEIDKINNLAEKIFNPLTKSKAYLYIYAQKDPSITNLQKAQKAALEISCNQKLQILEKVINEYINFKINLNEERADRSSADVNPLLANVDKRNLNTSTIYEILSENITKEEKNKKIFNIIKLDDLTQAKDITINNYPENEKKQQILENIIDQLISLNTVDSLLQAKDIIQSNLKKEFLSKNLLEKILNIETQEKTKEIKQNIILYCILNISSEQTEDISNKIISNIPQENLQELLTKYTDNEQDKIISNLINHAIKIQLLNLAENNLLPLLKCETIKQNYKNQLIEIRRANALKAYNNQ